ncbi:ion transporter [Microcella sp.]|uniref:ion transporter n=1 Tax=Microcella sp. TaxID=1913979 RepID=UPI002563950D|nr:ion transporter [Microcella sp.]MBX9472268.1 ion transporter [Microcella sp.]
MTAAPPSDDSATVSPGVFTSTTVQLAPYRIQWLARLMYGNAFEFVTIAVIIANAAALGVLTYSDLPAGVAATAIAIDRFAIIFYTIELVLRIVSYGRKPWMFFRNPWNVFDFIIVVAIPFLDGATVIFRLVRLLRILRIFRFLPEARILMLSMIKSVAPLANLAVLIGFLMFIYAMAGVYLFGTQNPEQWGNIGAAMITLTVMLTLENFPDSFLAGLEITPLALLFFLSYMFFIVFTVLNVLIGIVLTAMDQAREEVTADRATENLPTATGTIRLPRGGDDAATDARSTRAELDSLDAELDALASAGRASPDHIRRIRDEIDRLKSAGSAT